MKAAMLALRRRGLALIAALAFGMSPLAGISAEATAEYDSAWVGESDFVTLAPGESKELTVFFQNMGTATWTIGTPSQVDLTTCLDDKVTCNVVPEEAAWNPGGTTGWRSSTRYATHTQSSVAPGATGTFKYTVKAPSGATAGTYRFNGELVVSATGTKIHPEGYYHEAQVVGGTSAVTTADCAPTSIALSPFAQTPEVGASQTLSLVATCDAVPGTFSRQRAANVNMTFFIDSVSGSSSDLTLTSSTDASGAARMTYTRAGAGVDQVYAYVTTAPTVRSSTVTVTWRAVLTPTTGPTATTPPTTSGTARAFLLTTGDVGSGFVTMSEQASPIEEQATLWESYAPYASAIEMLRAFGFVDSWTRYLRREVGSGVYSVVSQATLYSTLQGANADHESNVADPRVVSPAFTTISGTVGDRSSLLRRELVLTATDGRPVAVTEVYLVFRSGTTSHTLTIDAYSGQLDLSLALQWARTQAARSQAAVLPTRTPTPVPVSTPVPTAAPTAPTGPTVTTLGGIPFTRTVSSAALYVETSVPAGQAISLRTGVDADVAQVQVNFGRAFAVRPKVYVFTTTGSMALGLQTIFGYPADIATSRASSVSGMFLPPSNSVVVNWANASQEVPMATVRHELVHMLVQQLAGPYAASVPAWLNEGFAAAEEYTFGVNWPEVRERYKAVSMAQVDTLLSLAEMTDYYTWGQRTPPLRQDQYAAAYGAVYLLRRDVGTAALVRLVDLVGQGVPFSSAFTETTGQNYASFALVYPSRLGSLGARPGVSTATDTPLGPGVYIVAYGFTPRTSVAISISGPAGLGSEVRTADHNGNVRVYYLRSSLIPGAYSVSAVGVNGSASTTVAVVSTASTDTLSTEGLLIVHDGGPEPLRDPVWLP